MLKNGYIWDCIKYDAYPTYLPQLGWLCMLLSYIYRSYQQFIITMNVYLDTNIFDRLEKIDSLEVIEKENYQKLYNAIIRGKIIVPYSNAHLNDLYRGYLKNPSYIEKHLSTLDAFTKDLCICQYWGDKEVLLHRRNVREFFENKKSDLEDETLRWADLINDYPHMQLTMELKKRKPLPPQMKKIGRAHV